MRARPGAHGGAEHTGWTMEGVVARCVAAVRTAPTTPRFPTATSGRTRRAGIPVTFIGNAENEIRARRLRCPRGADVSFMALR